MSRYQPNAGPVMVSPAAATSLDDQAVGAVVELGQGVHGDAFAQHGDERGRLVLDGDVHGAQASRRVSRSTGIVRVVRCS